MLNTIDENRIWLRNKFEHIMKDLNFEIGAFSDTVIITGSYDPHLDKKKTEILDATHYMILGDPVNEAASLHELAEWMGVSAASFRA